jgi:hypothetical protein
MVNHFQYLKNPDYNEEQSKLSYLGVGVKIRTLPVPHLGTSLSKPETYLKMQEHEYYDQIRVY